MVDHRKGEVTAWELENVVFHPKQTWSLPSLASKLAQSRKQEITKGNGPGYFKYLGNDSSFTNLWLDFWMRIEQSNPLCSIIKQLDLESFKLDDNLKFLVFPSFSCWNRRFIAVCNKWMTDIKERWCSIQRVPIFRSVKHSLTVTLIVIIGLSWNSSSTPLFLTMRRPSTTR